MDTEEFNKLSDDAKDIVIKISNTFAQEGLELSDREIRTIVECLDNSTTVDEAREVAFNKIIQAREGLKRLDEYNEEHHIK